MATIDVSGWRWLTVRQPWADLLVWGEKEYETRGWATPYRGPLVISAGMTMGEDERFIASTADVQAAIRRHVASPDTTAITLGAIVGVVDLIDVIPTERLEVDRGDISKREFELGNFEPGRFGWRCANPRAFAQPIDARGRQGLRALPAELHAAVAAALEAL